MKRTRWRWWIRIRTGRASRDKGPRYTPWSSQLRSAAANAWRRSSPRNMLTRQHELIIQSHLALTSHSVGHPQKHNLFFNPSWWASHDLLMISWSLCPLQPLQPLVASWSIQAVDSGCAPDQNCQGLHALRVALFLQKNTFKRCFTTNTYEIKGLSRICWGPHLQSLASTRNVLIKWHNNNNNNHHHHQRKQTNTD